MSIFSIVFEIFQETKLVVVVVFGSISKLGIFSICWRAKKLYKK